jgi:hypothetical protein
VADDKQKPKPWRGHNLRRALTTLEIELTTKRKIVLLGRILLNDATRKKAQEDYEKQVW